MSTTDRRAFLKLFLAGAAGLTLDPERLLWTPRTMVTVPALPWVATFNSKVNLAEWARRMDPEGRVPRIVELLSQTNEILDDLVWRESSKVFYQNPGLRSTFDEFNR